MIPNSILLSYNLIINTVGIAAFNMQVVTCDIDYSFRYKKLTIEETLFDPADLSASRYMNSMPRN